MSGGCTPLKTRSMTMKRKRWAKIGNLPPIQVVSDEEAEQANYVICMPNGSGEYFNDDVRTTCALCARGIHHRPHVPKTPAKVCIDCALKLSEKGPEAAN